MKAAVINIGSELLKGLSTNTNLQAISSAIDSLGVEVVLSIVVRDFEDELIESLKLAYEKADLIITTGGLGPTADDITRESVIKAFNLKSYTDEKLIELQQDIYGHVYKKMALVPREATVIIPERGSAAGWHLSVENRLLFVLPGVPDEMNQMLNNHIVPFLKENVINDRETKVLRFFDIKEVELEQLITGFRNISYGLLPKRGIVDVYLTATGRDLEEAAGYLKEPVSLLKEKFKNHYLGGRNSSFESEINEKLNKQKITLSTAESVTGGFIASRITDVPGSSEYYLGSAVTYSDKAKKKVLGVNQSTLEKYGAVSKEVAVEMALGGKSLYSSDCCLSSTGIAGPSGATEKKPVGLCYVGLAIGSDTFVEELRLKGSRGLIKNQIANQALAMLYKKLGEEKSQKSEVKSQE